MDVRAATITSAGTSGTPQGHAARPSPPTRTRFRIARAARPFPTRRANRSGVAAVRHADPAVPFAAGLREKSNEFPARWNAQRKAARKFHVNVLVIHVFLTQNSPYIRFCGYSRESVVSFTQIGYETPRKVTES